MLHCLWTQAEEETPMTVVPLPTDQLLVDAVSSLHEEARICFSIALKNMDEDILHIAGMTLALTTAWLGERGIDT